MTYSFFSMNMGSLVVGLIPLPSTVKEIIICRRGSQAAYAGRVLFRAQKVRGSQGRGIVHLHCDSECTIFCHASSGKIIFTRKTICPIVLSNKEGATTRMSVVNFYQELKSKGKNKLEMSDKWSFGHGAPALFASPDGLPTPVLGPKTL